MSESGHGAGRTTKKGIVRRLFRVLFFPIVILLSFSKGALVLLMAGAVALTVATATVSSVFNMVSSVVEAVVGPRTVRAKQTARFNALTTESDALKKRTGSLATENDALKKRAGSLATESDALKKRVGSLTTENDVLKKRAGSIVDENQRLTREIADAKTTYRAQVSGLADENQRLKEDLAKRKVSYRGKTTLAREAVKDTATRVTNRVTVASTRNVASVFAESLPFVGLAVILGATAWELNDACEMMKDLRELDLAFNPESAIDGKEICGMRPPTKTEVLEKLRESPADAWNAVKAYVPKLPNFEPTGFVFPDVSGTYQSGTEWATDLYCGWIDCEDLEEISE